MRFWLAACLGFLTACGQTDSEAQDQRVDELLGMIDENTPQAHDSYKKPEPSSMLDEDNQLRAEMPPLAPKFNCDGLAKQGGLIKCQSTPNAKIRISRGGDDFFVMSADENGVLLIGFDRDEKYAEIVLDDNPAIKHIYTFEPRAYDVSRIDGLPPSKVSTFTKAQLAHIRAASKRKKVGFASREKILWFQDGFTSPIKSFRKTTNFGAQRILNGEKKRPHYGVDMAAPKGTPILAPADGVVSLADDDMYFEGQMVMIDHGQGLNSIYLHMSKIDVKAGQVVKRGDQLGLVGSTGRSTGPHLCWRLKWRNRNLDPELLTKWPQK